VGFCPCRQSSNPTFRRERAVSPEPNSSRRGAEEQKFRKNLLPLKEQPTIAEYLDAKEPESHLISSTIETPIATLTAYRKLLIHACVTGQRRVEG
jgi:type I restriction enzyme S subunit